MLRLFLECTIRAALLVGATAILLSAMRVKAAAARHGVWAGVLALMLVLPIWTAWGPKLPLHLLPRLAPPAANLALAPAGIVSSSSRPLPLFSAPEAIVLGIYLLGVSVLLLRLATGTVRARRLARSAVLHNGMYASSSCAAPVTVGFFHPKVIVPEQWRQWTPAQLNIVLTHEREHARRRDPLVQWLALLNRALFWFHPVAWWLERHLSALAEEACDNVVLAHGHSPREYSEYLLDMARSVTRSGARVNVTGMAMPGSFLPKRIREIMEGGPAPRISRARMACVGVACAITSTAFAGATLDHAKQDSSTRQAAIQRDAASAAHPAAKFVLGDLKIEGDVHDPGQVRDRVLDAFKDREYNDGKELADEAAAEIRKDFQERGYFKVVVQYPASQPLGLTDRNQQRILIVASVDEGDQFRLKSINIQPVAGNPALSLPAATLREQFHLRDGDLFNVTEIRAGLERLKQLYGRAYPDFIEVPEVKIDSASRGIDFILLINEGPHKP